MALNPWIQLLIFISAIVLIWLVGFFVRTFLRRSKITPERYNAFNLIILGSQVIATIIAATTIYDVESNAILSVSALFGTAIGFALAVVIGNVVAGFYLISVRPFGIGDLIKVKEIDGIVMEIGLNYTKVLQLDKTIVLIPNKGLLDAKLINCSIKIDDIKDRAEKGFEIGFRSLMEDLQDVHDEKHIGKKLADEILGGKEIVRYPFTVQLKLNIISPDIPMKSVNKRMKGLLNRWEEKLGFRPIYFYNKYIFRQDVRVIMIVDSPEIILEQQSNFLEDLYTTVFEELHEEMN